MTAISALILGVQNEDSVNASSEIRHPAGWPAIGCAMMQDELEIATHGAGLTEITDQIAPRLSGSGLLTVFVRHTSCSLLIQENADPSVRTDLVAFFERLVPPGDTPQMRWLTHIYEGPDDMPAHIKAALLPVSLQIPVQNGRMVLGTWQGIYLFEHRTRPHRRRVFLHLG